MDDDADTLETLFRGLVRWRVRPYYLHQMDVAEGCEHLRTPIAKGLEIIEQQIPFVIDQLVQRIEQQVYHNHPAVRSHFRR